MSSNEPLEIERKYLIKRPSAEKIQELNCISITDIEQIYLVSNCQGVSRRIRKRGTEAEGYKYYYTEKKFVSSSVRVEREGLITEDEYLKLKSQADPDRFIITKTRHCFLHEGRMYEMDLFPFSVDLAFLEIELDDPEDIPEHLPDLEIIRDVTDDKNYTNKAIARSLKITE